MLDQIDAQTEAVADHGAELAVIGSILMNGDAINRVADRLRSEHFDSQTNQIIYKAMEDMKKGDFDIDQQTLRSWLEANGNLENVGGDHYLSTAVLQAPHHLGINSYADIVIRLFMLRQLVDAGFLAVSAGSDSSNFDDPEAAIRAVEQRLFEIGSTSIRPDFVRLEDSDAVKAYLEDSDTPDLGDEGGPISTGLEPIDELLGGLHRSDLVIVAARPGYGKSTLALNCALNVGKQYKPAPSGEAGKTIRRSVGIFSLEMSTEQVVHRLAAAHSRTDITTIRMKQWSRSEYYRIADAFNMLKDLNIYVDDTPMQNVSDMRTKAQRLKDRYDLDLLIVDYMQLMSGAGSGREGNRVQEVSEISRYLKAIARDLDVPVIACSQLNREVEHRKSHEPRLSDLRESGSIEQDADVVMFIQRDDKVFSEEDWFRRNPTQDYPRGIAKLIVAKHRHGPTGDLTLAVRDEWGLFSSLEYSDSAPS